MKPRQRQAGGVARTMLWYTRKAIAAAPKPGAESGLQPAVETSNWRVAMALSLVEAEYRSTSLDLETASARVGVTKSHLCRLFRREVGAGFPAYLKGFRAGRAMLLLRETILSVKEVAAAVGFSYVTQLDRAFVGRFGVSPTAFRQLSRPLPGAEQQIPNLKSPAAAARARDQG